MAGARPTTYHILQFTLPKVDDSDIISFYKAIIMILTWKEAGYVVHTMRISLQLVV